jgi:lipopolysaccharide/colanic/teichoic acid biosynthesis glycosyltransferase
VIARTPKHTPLTAPTTTPTDLADRATTVALVRPRRRRLYHVTKRLLDLAVALLVLALLAPLLVAVALLILLDTGGPVIFRREMIGLDGRLFWMYKFRTMAVNAEQLLLLNPELYQAYQEQHFKLKRDPRVTSAGRILRKYSIDELPQLWNVVRGEMSLVGPRSIPTQELEPFGDFAALRQTVKPGITGLWQVSGRADTTYTERVRLDQEYLAHWSLGLDLWIIACTPIAILRGVGAY